APVKARLLDQEAIAGVGNILADEALWLAKIHPARPVNKLSRAATDRLGGAVRQAVASAIEGGGVHTLTMVDSRRPDGRCPRCGTLMKRGAVGGRTTWWCPREQRCPSKRRSGRTDAEEVGASLDGSHHRGHVLAAVAER